MICLKMYIVTNKWFLFEKKVCIATGHFLNGIKIWVSENKVYNF